MKSILEYRAVNRSASIVKHYAIWMGVLFSLNAVLLVFLCYVVPHMRARYKAISVPLSGATKLILAMSTRYADGWGWLAALVLVFSLAVPLAYFTARIEVEALRRRRVMLFIGSLAGLVALFLVLATIALWLPLIK